MGDIYSQNRHNLVYLLYQGMIKKTLKVLRSLRDAKKGVMGSDM